MDAGRLAVSGQWRPTRSSDNLAQWGHWSVSSTPRTRLREVLLEVEIGEIRWAVRGEAEARQPVGELTAGLGQFQMLLTSPARLIRLPLDLMVVPVFFCWLAEPL